MARPKNTRILRSQARTRFFKPCSEIAESLPVQTLALEEFEAIRLADYEQLSQQEAAESMGVSRHTFGRVLANARKKLAHAVVFGECIQIHGGTYAMSTPANRLIKDNPKMRIAISSEGPMLEDMVDPRFGRAAGFVIYDTETQETQWIDNGEAQMAAQAAGLMATELVANAQAKVVLSGYVGPKALQALQTAGIQVAQDLDNRTVAEAIEAFLKGEADILVPGGAE